MCGFFFLLERVVLLLQFFAVFVELFGLFLDFGFERLKFFFKLCATFADISFKVGLFVFEDFLLSLGARLGEDRFVFLSSRDFGGLLGLFFLFLDLLA